MRAGVLPGGDEVCHGYHVWDEPERPSECIRCGFIDYPPRDHEIRGQEHG